MAISSENFKQRFNLVTVDECAEVASRRVPVRRMLGSSGTSVLIHLVVLLVLGLIVIAQQDTTPPLVTEVQFSELPGDGEAALDLTDPDLLEIQITSLNIPTVTTLIVPDSGTTADTNIDLSAFVSNSANQSDSGLPAAIAGIASGIQGRVKKAGGQTGEVQFSLAWHSLNDVDLHVIVPSGERISYSHRTSACRGNLDVDMNADSQVGGTDKKFSDEPVENVRWLDRTAPSGRFTVIVNQYRWRRGHTNDPYQLLVKLGDETQLVEDEVSAQKSVSIHRFQYVKSSLPKSRREKLAVELTLLQTREEAQATELYDAAFKLPKGGDRTGKMMTVVNRYPHTDASIRAMQELDPVAKK